MSWKCVIVLMCLASIVIVLRLVFSSKSPDNVATLVSTLATAQNISSEASLLIPISTGGSIAPIAKKLYVPGPRNPGYIEASCELDLDIETWDQRFRPWTSNGEQPFAMVLFGGVSFKDTPYRPSGVAGAGHEFVAIGPCFRHYERHLFTPNNGQVDVFMFSWAPTAELREELVSLYRPFHQRFERQEDWEPRFREAMNLTKRTSSKAAPSLETYRVSMWVSIHMSLDLVRTHESARGWRYQGVVLCRPDVVLKLDLVFSEYSLDSNVFHNPGNQNTGDMLFVMSSLSAERFGCIIRFLPEAEYYGGFKEHSQRFLPLIVPDLTGAHLVDSDEMSAIRLFPRVTGTGGIDGDGHTTPGQLRAHLARSVWAYRKLVASNRRCTFSDYDRKQRRRCSTWSPSVGYDHICRSYKHSPDAAPPFAFVQPLKRDKWTPIEVQFSELMQVCKSLPDLTPSPELEARGRSVIDVIFN